MSKIPYRSMIDDRGQKVLLMAGVAIRRESLKLARLPRSCGSRRTPPARALPPGETGSGGFELLPTRHSSP